MRTYLVFLVMLMCFGHTAIRAQTVNFEETPDGLATTDLQPISTEYSASPFNVSFEIVDTSSEAFLAFPVIAKVGLPLTAFFAGCGGPTADTPLPGQGVGESFLTDDTSLGLLGNLRVSYSVPVSAASGVILDVDAQEEWTITARNASGAVVAEVVVVPEGPPGCLDGPGDSLAHSWSVESATDDIVSILIRYTGATAGPGLAFDNFNTSSATAPLPFTRGDSNSDGTVDIADPVSILEYLFQAGTAGCLDANDCNDDGLADIADSIFCLSYLFALGTAIPAPHPGCGQDPTVDGLNCDRFSACP